MQNTTILDALPKPLFRLKEKLGGILNEKYGIYTLSFDNNLGKGTIKYNTVIDYVTVTDIDILLNEDLIYNIGDQDSNFLYFIYSTAGSCYYKTQNSEKFIRIEELRPTIIACNTGASKQLNIKKYERFILNIIEVDKDKFETNFANIFLESNVELEIINNLFKTSNSQLYSGAFNLKISEKLRVLRNEIIKTPISGLLNMESLYLNILSQHLEQFHSEVNDNAIAATLSKSELQKIRLLTEFITKNPEIQHSINSLCTQITMSPAKLQEGFKAMHDTTVADFVRNVRIEKAEKLLVETDLNISEIVYTIGLTSRSYFCKIFKKKYNSSPKRYRKLILQKN